MPRKAQTTVFTIGHSTRSLAEFVALLQESAMTRVIDVRSIPRSRAVPQFNGDTFPGALASYGIAYSHLIALGGRRHHAKGAPPSPNTFWRVAAFRNYADYAETAAFREGLEQLLAIARDERCAIMCAEAVWWRCHRRIITDYLLAARVHVMHIMGPHAVVAATRTPGARLLAGGRLRYRAPRDPVT
jgi:uncharacterized protein (DUF488 family)